MEDRSGTRHESHGRRWSPVLDGRHRINALLHAQESPVPLHTPKPYLTLVELPKATKRPRWWRFWGRGS